MEFNIIAKDQASKARSGIISTPKGRIHTPVFMPVGTLGSVKGVHQRELEKDLDFKVILGNSYHLYLRPGLDVLKNAGGLHRFIHWDRFILTDSGGYQVYSIATKRKITEEGVSFQSHIDGSRHFISPEKAMEIQRAIGADFMMAFDECTPYPCEYQYAEKSMHLTHRWLKRCVSHFNKTSSEYEHSQYLFPICQGSVYPDLRKISAEAISESDSPGNAIGGLSVGEPAEMMYEITNLVTDILPVEKPRYLMGVGTPANILESIALGIDMFDCVMPTRNARHGLLYTPEGIINIKNEKWKNNFGPINEEPLSFVDQYYSLAYLRHLVYSDELLGLQIASLNNLAFYNWLVKQAGMHIEAGDFTSWKKEMVEKVSRRRDH